jgi:hypothetical protein
MLLIVSPLDGVPVLKINVNQWSELTMSCQLVSKGEPIVLEGIEEYMFRTKHCLILFVLTGDLW